MEGQPGMPPVAVAWLLVRRAVAPTVHSPPSSPFSGKSFGLRKSQEQGLQAAQGAQGPACGLCVFSGLGKVLDDLIAWHSRQQTATHSERAAVCFWLVAAGQAGSF
ncbi:hypothetical protein CGLO_17920 [Colletotrichum gloeosporioides Cg-14]|uniref:Uncharacterized protein n=1 Tax=Colletotrichum gloeosporioides (strain Cg-14) TaxID=1237896 RepID=T0JSB0_COLGC|nr:hypothetical protein CGLO_17920 [Colletotrichum gloeosporioides Cg-14]